MNFDIKNRVTGRNQFTTEIDCAESTSLSVKLGLAVKRAIVCGADLTGADLTGANLIGADLTDADLTDAYLTCTDLTGADLTDADLTGAANVRELAANYRKENSLEGKGGVIIISDAVAVAWLNKLRDPQSWEPGSIAVDDAGNRWVAVGGDPRDGAASWVVATD